MNQSAIKNRGDFPYWGIDGCKAGWLCVGLNCEGEHCAFVAEDIRCAYQKMKAQKAKVALIDIPIGLSDNEAERGCDKCARRFIGKRHSSVFRVPCRQAMEAYKGCADHETGKEAGKRESRRITGGPLSLQTWAIAPKIAEVDSFLQCSVYKRKKEFALRETHPEVCFRALSPCDADLESNKKKLAGKNERRKILASHLSDAENIESEIKRCHKSGVADDDILDAMVAAVTAKAGCPYETLPPKRPPKDSRGLPMEMVFSKGKTHAEKHRSTRYDPNAKINSATMKTRGKLRVGLLLCDDVDEDAQARYGTYSDMFRNSIAAVDGGLALHPVHCDRGELPDSPDDFDAYLISGSRHAVYDAQPWIAQLQAFVRDCRARRKKTVGVCFGHQLIAHACGGEARQAGAGWGLGVHKARITARQPWMQPWPAGADDYQLVAIHQDQVAALPPGFRVIAASDFCPVSMFTGDGVMLGIQGHPEFDKAFCEYRIHARRAQLRPEVYRRALDSLALQPDAARVCNWIARFIRGADD